MRLCLYLIQRNDQVRSDWIFFFNHTISAGTTKCLIVLGITLEDFRRTSGPLTHQDLTVLSVLPVETSNGEVVHAQLKKLSQQYGVPIATVSDRGSDLKKGVELLQQDHPDIVSLYDNVHLVSRGIKAIFEADTQWELYRKECNQCANYLRQSQLAHLKPPTPKTKARYMNYDREVRWAIRALAILDRVTESRMNARQQERLPVELLKQRLGWLEAYRVQGSMWLEVIWTGQAINEIVRRNGYSVNTPVEVRLLIVRLKHKESVLLVEKTVTEIERMCSVLDSSARLPGSTEVLESLIGKGKRLLHHGGNSITPYVLSLAAATTQISKSLVQKALSTCRTKHVFEWAKNNFSHGVQALRAVDLQTSNQEKNLRKALTTATPNF